jgi:hypothetical protein
MEMMGPSEAMVAPPCRLPPEGQADGPAGEHLVRPRQTLGQRLIAVPILPDGSPDWEHRLAGVLRELSPDGVTVELDSPADLTVVALALVLPDPRECTARCAGVEVRSARRLGSGRLEVGGSFGGLGDALFRPENLVPRFHPESMTFATAFPEDVLCKWAEAGILRPVLADRVQVCPLCQGLPTFRRGCPNCGAVRITNDQFIHHFTCAHVGLVEAFTAPGELICPKCRTSRLVVGADYEYLTGLHRCLDCHWTGAELEHVGQCLRCEFRFPEDQACEVELRGYHADRLDTLALLPGE